MTKLQKNLFVFIAILLQTVTAISSGLVVLYFSVNTHVPPNIFVEELDIGNLDRRQASKKLQDFYEDNLKKASINISIPEEKVDFKVNFEDIDAKVDYEATVTKAWGRKGNQSVSNLINGYFVSEKKILQPVVSFNEEKLKKELSNLSAQIFKDAVLARIYLRNDQIIKVSSVNGKRLNIDNAMKKIKNSLASEYKKDIQFSYNNNFELEVFEPEVVTEDLEGLDDILSTYSTEISSVDKLDSIKKAVSAINRVLVFAADPKRGEEAGVFSFNKYMAKDKLIKEQNDEGYNQVVSTLHAAVLLSGIKPEGITRYQNKAAVKYIEAGLDARVFGSIEDYKFRNTLENNIVVFAEIKDNKIATSIVGKKKDRSLSHDISIVVEERKKPGVIRVENKELPKGQKRVVSPGQDGLKVSVFGILRNEKTEVEKTLIYTNTYEPRNAIVQVGPNTPESSVVENLK